jgi:dienelactone hydrolase
MTPGTPAFARTTLDELRRGKRDTGHGIRESGTPVPRIAAALTAAMYAGILLHASTVRPAELQTVTFAARDGVTVTGALALPDKTPAPAVLLLPMMSRTLHDFDAVSARLADSGIAALAIDFRRNGGARSGGGTADEPGDFSDLVLDAEAARAYLSTRPEIIGSKVGLLGASLGANVAVLVAGQDSTIPSLALLSASLEYRGLRMEQALKKFGSRPALLIVSSEDPYALRSARQAVTMGDGPRELRVLSGAGHGTVMLSRDPDLVSTLVDWFQRTLL